MKYSLGLDIGISSVGWGILKLDDNDNPTRIIDTGVKIFSPGEVPKTGASKNLERRTFRGARRIIRRREFRTDRVRYLLNLNGYLGSEIFTGTVSDVNENLTKIYDEMVNKYYQGKDISPYELKVKALDEKLSKEELSIILVHYAKHRGYKSNRVEDNDSENGKVLKSIKENEELMHNKKYRTLSEMFIKDLKFKNRIRNSSNDYKLSATREMYLDEINKVLDSQIAKNLITPNFKNDYLKIWSSQRSYAKGPGGDSKYGGDLIQKMTGKCIFDGNSRAPKGAPSSEIFVALTNLINLRYKDEFETYQKLTSDEIKNIIELGKSQNNVSYNAILKLINHENSNIKGLIATNKEKANAIETLKKKYKLTDFEYNKLTPEEENDFLNFKKYEVNKRTAFQLKSYSNMRKSFINDLGTDEWNKIRDNYEFLDYIAKVLTDYKINEDIIKNLKNNNIDEKYFETIKSLPNLADHIRLSSEIVRKLIPIMLNGVEYDKAMEQIGYNHSDLNSNKEKLDLLIPINEGNEITNQRVIRSLAESRGIINSIIKKYGHPYRINIETARELTKNLEERNELTKSRDENEEKNQKTKASIAELYGKDVQKISKNDVFKYNLWLEQQAKCPYCQQQIEIDDVLGNNTTQIDHILPYSRTFDDSYFNKTLVHTSCNQNKRNETPYEWFGKTEKWNNYSSLIKSWNISEKKKDNYLLQNLTLEEEAEYRNQNLNDTKYVAKYLVSYVKANLNVNKVGCPNGSITGKLRNYWKLNGLTSSLESSNYHITDEDRKEHKNRDNNLHHALDAIVIASCNDTVIRRVSDFEMFSRYLNARVNNLHKYAIQENASDVINTYYAEDGKEYISSLKDYAKLLENKQSYKFNQISMPYDNFAEEAIVRVYEQDKKTMYNKLKMLNYTDEDANLSTPIIPKFEIESAGGKLHGETYYNIKKFNSSEKVVSRIDIASPKFKKEKLELILEKDGGSKAVYDSVKNWLSDYDNGKIAYEKNGGYPTNLLSGNIIKKIKICSDFNGKGHIINNRLVDKENVCKIIVYKKDNKLFFAGLDYYDTLLYKTKKEGIELVLWYGQNKNKIIVNSNDLASYANYLTLKPNELINITLNNGVSGMAYVVGFSSGMLQVESYIGDNFDIVGEGKLFATPRKNQYQITISTIMSIEKVKINNLGKIE